MACEVEQMTVFCLLALTSIVEMICFHQLSRIFEILTTQNTKSHYHIQLEWVDIIQLTAL